jgi:hypothetical protein
MYAPNDTTDPGPPRKTTHPCRVLYLKPTVNFLERMSKTLGYRRSLSHRSGATGSGQYLFQRAPDGLHIPLLRPNVGIRFFFHNA